MLIKKNRVSGSITLLNKLIDVITDYVKSTKVHSSVVYKNIKLNTSGFKEDDTGNMLVLKGFIDEFLGKFEKVNSSNDNKRKYLTYLVNYKKRWDDIVKKIAENVLREINFIDKTVVLFSNSSSVVSIFKSLAKKKIFPVVLQCESNPEKEGLVQAKILRGLGFRVKVVDEKNISKYLNKIDFAILGCDGYNDKHFINKRGTNDLVSGLRTGKIPVYVLSDSRKYTKKTFKNSKSNGKSLFEQIPLRMIAKLITE
jgi:translation initiation factor 2B subunit (eIF-2B alpha/beta/delta family)